MTLGEWTKLCEGMEVIDLQRYQTALLLLREWKPFEKAFHDMGLFVVITIIQCELDRRTV